MRNAVILLCALAGVAAAKPVDSRRVGDKLKAIDLKPVIDKLDVYKDDLGNYYVTPKARAFESSDEEQKWLFYGDGKAMYRQRVIGSGSDGDRREWHLWSPRARGLNTAGLHIDPKNLYVQCASKDDGKRKLTQLTADEAATLIKRAKFYPKLWQRSAHYLARDDEGVYYYVDALLEEYGGRGFRVFVGQKGVMKQLPMTNMVSDSAGEIYATKTGQLKIIMDRQGKQAFWIKGSKKVELTPLAPLDNRYLIYRELGIYGQLGVVCDDQ